ncbi:MAG: hypothetical protein ACLS3M_08210 [Collinsella sp.]
METIINVDDVSFSMARRRAGACIISLGVNRGDFIGIIGPSGAGSSHLPPLVGSRMPTITPARSLPRHCQRQRHL